MHKVKDMSPAMQEVLTKMRGKKEVQVSPASYSSRDVLAAKEVLDRLMASPRRNEISYIKVTPIEVEA